MNFNDSEYQKKMEDFISEKITRNYKYDEDGNLVAYDSIEMEDILTLGLDEDDLELALDTLSENGIEIIGDNPFLGDKPFNHDVSERKRLSTKEVNELLKKYHDTKDKNVLNKLFLNYLDSTNKKSLNLGSYLGLDLDDSLIIGQMALFKALQNHDINKSNNFSNYLFKYIKGYLLRFRSSMRSSSDISIRLSDKIESLKARVEYEYAEKLSDCGDNYDNIISEIVSSVCEEEDSKDLVMDVLRIDNPYCIEVASGESYDDSSINKIFEDADFFDKSESLKAILDQCLTDEEKQILTSRFGLKDGQMHTLSEVGKEIGMTMSLVLVKERKALSKLKSSSYSEKLRSYIK